LWRMAIILKANKVNLFVSSVLFVFWYHSPNVLDTLHICNISWLRVKGVLLLYQSYTHGTYIFKIIDTKQARIIKSHENVKLKVQTENANYVAQHYT
jgi:hypothetical protein